MDTWTLDPMILFVLVCVAAALVALYFVIKAAVKKAIIEARHHVDESPTV